MTPTLTPGKGPRAASRPPLSTAPAPPRGRPPATAPFTPSGPRGEAEHVHGQGGNEYNDEKHTRHLFYDLFLFNIHSTCKQLAENS